MYNIYNIKYKIYNYIYISLYIYIYQMSTINHIVILTFPKVSMVSKSNSRQALGCAPIFGRGRGLTWFNQPFLGGWVLIRFDMV